jgi:hypothetical protein
MRHKSERIGGGNGLFMDQYIGRVKKDGMERSSLYLARMF